MERNSCGRTMATTPWCAGGLGQLRQLLARLLADADPGLAADGDQPFEAVVMAFAGHQNLVKAALAGLERLFNRVNSVENFHERIV